MLCFGGEGAWLVNGVAQTSKVASHHLFIFEEFLMDVSKCLPEVVDLVNHLRSTGTGQSKLDQLLEIGCQTGSLDTFLEYAKANVSSGTFDKINKYWGAKTPTPVPATPTPVPAAPVVEKKVMHPMPSNTPKKK